MNRRRLLSLLVSSAGALGLAPYLPPQVAEKYLVLTDNELVISLRMIRSWDITTDGDPSRIDVLINASDLEILRERASR